jgi:hypothetical protein
MMIFHPANKDDDRVELVREIVKALRDALRRHPPIRFQVGRPKCSSARRRVRPPQLAMVLMRAGAKVGAAFASCVPQIRTAPRTLFVSADGGSSHRAIDFAAFRLTVSWNDTPSLV